MHEVKVISCNKTRYKPTLKKRAVDIRAEKLQEEYMVKAREADRVYNHTPVGTIGAVERKLVELGEVRGIVAGKGPVKSRDHEVSEQLRLRLPNQTTDRRFVSEKDT